MSLINAAAPYRRDDRQTVRVPVVMPLVEVDVDESLAARGLVDRRGAEPRELVVHSCSTTWGSTRWNDSA